MNNEITADIGGRAVMRAVLRQPTPSAQAAWRQRKREKGLCIVCGVLDTRPERTTCQRCHEARKTRRRLAQAWRTLE